MELGHRLKLKFHQALSQNHDRRLSNQELKTARRVLVT